MNSPEVMLARISVGLECELLAASDDEILQAAEDLGMNPTMKGSAAFAGVKYPAGARQFRDFFGITDWDDVPFDAERLAQARGLLSFFGSQRKDKSGK
jgi:hypothetical protein